MSVATGRGIWIGGALLGPVGCEGCVGCATLALEEMTADVSKAANKPDRNPMRSPDIPLCRILPKISLAQKPPAPPKNTLRSPTRNGGDRSPQGRDGPIDIW